MPPITEAKLYEAFGLTPPQEQGAQEQPVAEAAAEGTQAEPTEGEQVQEVAAPAVEESQPEEPEVAPTEDAPGQPAQEKAPLSEEQRRINAARRRQQEQQAAIEQAVQAERAKHSAMLDDLFAKAGLKNTFTGEPITNLDQFQEWNRKFEEARLQRELKSGKLTVEGLNQVVSQHPAIQQAQQLIEQQQAQQKAQQQAQQQARIKEEMEQIARMDPTIQSVADLLNMPTAAQFKEYVGKGYSFLDAFKLSNMESLATAKAEAAKQEALNNARGKDHLKAAGNARGSGAASVPAKEMQLFRQMNPGKSDAEIQKFYNNYLSRKGG